MALALNPAGPAAYRQIGFFAVFRASAAPRSLFVLACAKPPGPNSGANLPDLDHPQRPPIAPNSRECAAYSISLLIQFPDISVSNHFRAPSITPFAQV
jgi:hypothetical protein